MVDYSKWDRMDFSDSDNDDDDDGNNNNNNEGPRVTSLDQPGRVTIGPDGTLEFGKSNNNDSKNSKGSGNGKNIKGSSSSNIKKESSSSSSQSQPQSKLQKEGDLPTVSGSISGDAVDISPSSHCDGPTVSPTDKKREKIRQWRDRLIHNGGEHHFTVNTKNQANIKLPVYWSQDRYEVTLRLGIPSTTFPTRSIRVRVTGALSYADRFSAVGSGAMMADTTNDDDDNDDEPSYYGSVEIISCVSNKNNKEEKIVLLKGKLPRPIHLNKDEDEIDYEIEDYLDDGNGDNGSKGGNDEHINKLVTITMPKAVPMHGMVIWWDCPLIGYPQIDVSAIQERQNPLLSANNTGGEARTSTTQQHQKQQTNKDAKKEAFQKAWEEAHVMFREKMKAKKKQEVEMDD